MYLLNISLSPSLPLDVIRFLHITLKLSSLHDNFQLFSIQYFRQLSEITEMKGSWVRRLSMDKINLSFFFATAEYQSCFVWFTSIRWTSRIFPVLVVSPSFFFISTPLTFCFCSRFLRLRDFSLKSLDPRGSLRNCLKAERNLLVRR